LINKKRLHRHHLECGEFM